MERTTAAFYDSQVARKIEDFENGNRRIDLAWKTLLDWAPTSVTMILEIGCGIGSVSWALARNFIDANVIGVDFSERSISTAKHLFIAPNLRFHQGSFPNKVEPETIDLLVMMDVYEHIPPSSRPQLLEQIKRVLSPQARIFLSCPSPSYLQWLRVNRTEEVQPVDEEIGLQGFIGFADAIQRDILSFQNVDVWDHNDYHHAVLGIGSFRPSAPQEREEAHSGGIAGLLGMRMRRSIPWWPSAKERLKLTTEFKTRLRASASNTSDPK